VSVASGRRVWEIAPNAEYELRAAQSNAPSAARISAGSGWPWAARLQG